MTLWGSPWDGRDRAPLRIAIAVVAGLSQAVEAFQVGWQSRDPVRYPPTGSLSRWLAELPGAAWILLAVVLAGLVGVARDRRPIASALLALAAAAVLSEWQTQIFGSPSRNAFFPGAVLLGWTLGQAWAHNVERAPGRDLRERLGEAGALGCLAAGYVGSGLSKLLTTGVSWADGAQVRALVLEQQPIANWGWLASYRAAIIDAHEVAIAASIATLVIETGAFLLLFGPRLRAVWGGLLLLLHVNITLLNTMPYVAASLLIIALCLRPGGGHDAPSRPARFPLQMVVLLVCIVVAAWALTPLGWRATG